MKKTIYLLALGLLLFKDSRAQSVVTSRVYFDAKSILKSPEPRWGGGLSGGITRTAMDFGLKGISWQAGLNLNAVALRCLHVNADVVQGKLVGGPMLLNDLNGIKNVKFEGSFTQVSGVVRLLPLRLFMWDRLDPWVDIFTYVYGGLGFGVIMSDTRATRMLSSEFGSLGRYKGTNNVFIQELGMDIPVAGLGRSGKLFVTLNYRFHKSNTDNLDGFDPLSDSNLHKDVYNTYTAGVMVKF